MQKTRATIYPSLITLCTILACDSSWAQEQAPPDIVISEIQYHPHGDLATDEFLEIENRDLREIDLSGWIFVSGITFAFPEGTRLAPGQALVLSPDREATMARYGLEPSQVIGDYGGRLDNSDEILHLLDTTGRSIFKVHYRDGGGWSSQADGKGPSLELKQGYWDPDHPESWRKTIAPGNPGVPTREIDSDSLDRVILPSGAEWIYFEGDSDPPGPSLDWTHVDYQDGGWARGAEPFGYGPDIEVGTELAEMWGTYLSFYARLPFQISAEEISLLEADSAQISINIQYDDAFVLYLNGTELTRENVSGNPGDAVPFDTQADNPETGSRSLSLSGANHGFRLGNNVLSVHGLNRSLFSGDFLISLTARLTAEAAKKPDFRINELQPGEDGTAGFIEFFNKDNIAQSLAGYRVTDSAYRSLPYVFPAQSRIEARSFLALQDIDLPFDIVADGRTYLLLEPSGKIEDSFESRVLLSGFSLARYPDGDKSRFMTPTPSEGAANEFSPEERIVINEIHYNPADQAGSALEFIELYNRSNASVSLAGWNLSDAVSFDFPAGARIPPRDYLIIASNPDAFEEQYGRRPQGPFTGQLANDEEEIDLRDPDGNIADRVHYADDGAWHPQADGRGSSLELIHPDLDNRYGEAWTQSPPRGTPGRPNVAFSNSPDPRVVSVKHRPVVPGAGDAVVVSCRVIGTTSVQSVRISWRNETLGSDDEVVMNDTGIGADKIAEDGVFTGAIPAQSNESTISFVITASDEQGSRTAPGNGRSYLYEVNAAPRQRKDVVHYSLLMTNANWRELRTRGNGSNTLLDGTFVDHQENKTYYNVGVRYRGNGSRNPPDGRFNYRIQFSDDKKFQGLKRLNLNSQNPHRQLLGNSLFRSLNIPYPLTVPVIYRFDRTIDARYVQVEAYDDEFLQRFYDGDDGGNLYRGNNGRLDFRGDDSDRYRGRYDKASNEEEDDFSDLIELTRLFTITDDDEFIEALESRVDVLEWIDYFAAQGALGNIENSINLDAGDDYFMYARESDGRFMMLPWDSDSVFQDSTQRLFRPSSAAVSRLLLHPRYAPQYFCALDRFRQGLMGEENIFRWLGRMDSIYRPGEIDDILNFLPRRHEFIESKFPRQLTLTDGGALGTVLISEGEEWSFFRGTREPSQGNLSWATLDFDDSNWERGPSGFGYGDGDDATVFDDMFDNYPTIFVRKIFEIDDAEAVESLTLRIDYDDGFVAYLNGAEIARRNYDELIPRSDDTATQDREAGQLETFSLDGFLDILQSGENIIAIVVFNGDIDSSDVSMIPILEAVLADGAESCENVINTSNSQIRLSGFLPACESFGVRINGQEGAVDPREPSWEYTLGLDPGPNAVVVEAVDFRGTAVARLEFSVERTGGIEELGGRITADRTLSAVGGPYRVTGNLVVEAGVELVIEAGSELLLAPASRLTIDGNLRVLGRTNSPVVFRNSACGESWQGIQLNGTGDHSLDACIFEGGSPIGAGLIEVSDGRLDLHDSRFLETQGTALAVLSGSVEVTSTTFESPMIAITLSGGELTLMDVDVDLAGSVGILVSGGILEASNSHISAEGEAIRLEAGGHSISRCVLHASGVGLNVHRPASVNGDENTIAGNSLGIRTVDRGAGPRGAILLSNHIVWANSIGIGIEGEVDVDFEYSDVQDALPPGEGNISADPLFVSSNDFRLREGSPAIGSGRNGANMGALPSVSGTLFIRGDSDMSGAVNLSDAVVTLLWLFQGGSPVACIDGADSTDDGRVNLTDPVFTLNHLFISGPAPAAPYPDPGVDPTPDNLDCLP